MNLVNSVNRNNTNVKCFSEVPPPNIIAKGDSAASQNYWREEDEHCLQNIRPYSGPSVVLPDADTIAPTKKGSIPLSTKLSPSAQTTTILPQLKSSSLISLGQICDDDCTVILDKKNLVAIKDKNVNCTFENKDIIFKGYRNNIDRLWDIPISNDRY